MIWDDWHADAVTKSVDVDTDKLMQIIIREEFKEATIITIAHRLETILDFDRVAVLDNGVLVEIDSPQALLSRPSAFRDLYETYQTASVEATEKDVFN